MVMSLVGLCFGKRRSPRKRRGWEVLHVLVKLLANNLLSRPLVVSYSTTVMPSVRQTRLYSPGCLEGFFSATGLPVYTILGNRACGVRGSFNTSTYRYTPLVRCRLRQALRSSLKLATKAIKKMSAGKPKNMMASQYVSTVKLM